MMSRVCGLATSAILHAAVMAMLVIWRPQQPDASEPPPRTSGSGRTFVVTPAMLSTEDGDQVLAGEEQQGSGVRDVGESQATDLRVGFDVDVATIRARRNWLFPFLTTDFLFLERADQERRSAQGRGFTVDAAKRRTSSRPALWIPDGEVQALVDRAWSRRERWPRFSEIAALVEAHDPDEGRVADLLHAYLDQNLLQPYHDASSRDPRFWAMLSCVADHVEFVDWVRSFTRQHPSSKVTTELLFLLDELAQGSRDTLLMMLATNPDPDLQATRERNREAYDFAVSVRRQYGEWLEERQLQSSTSIRGRYDEVRLRILSTIIETTPGGYRAADARFLAGEILFNRNDWHGALAWWRKMRPAPTDSYALTASELLHELASPKPNAAQINRILGAEYGRWVEFSRGRLRQFGYTFDTF